MTNGAPSVAVPQPPPPANEIVDLDVIPGQIGHAILRASDGTILRPPSGNLTERDVGIVYRMLLEIGTVLEGEGLQRVTVGFRSVSYAIAFGGGDGCLYIVKKRSMP
eukprot:CAMPEP_0172312542 /NCGR_PEP_ID=MMETSP1058-20130122/17860_1 /TAXON_ID=83371 /ORGANISM="Detonula confervacea, Strain CCMP 353" /LENGTH=106 /DNA_ID=CAMNT_0013026027 /DNA_START=73 /DNA_END=396 /DNA_ORIENTATION=+